LTEALALAHDIGHPPFAHSGEEELNRQMQRFGEQFNHNLHALRLVETFEQRYARFPGLNLTFEVREGMAKHSRDFERGESPVLDEYLPGLRPPLEAQLIDPADEIAYNTADLDDAYSAQSFDAAAIASAVPEYGELWEDAEMQFPGAPEKVKFQETLRRLIDHLASGLIEGTGEGAMESGVGSAEEIRRYPRRLARFSPGTQLVVGSLKKFLHQRVYFSEELQTERARSVAMIRDLFQFFLDNPGQLPGNYREQAEQQPPHRVVCDYIAGMTDGFFMRVYNNSGQAAISQFLGALDK